MKLRFRNCSCKESSHLFFTLMTLSFLCSCGGVTTPPDDKYIKDFYEVNFLQSADILEEDNLALFVDYSTCIALGQNSPFYQKLIPSFVEATKSYYSIKGEEITKEEPADTYNRLLNIQEVNYADLKSAAEQIANGKTEGVLLTDGEYFNPTIAGGNPNNPYLAKAFKTWMKKGHDIFIISEPYVESGVYNKKRFYFLFTDTRLKNNIYDRIIETADLDQYPDVQLFHLSADHPTLLAEGQSSIPNPILAAEIKPNGFFEIQDWTVDWNTINNYILGAVDEQTGEPLPNGDYLIKGLKIDRNSFGGYRIKNIGVKVYDLNNEYMQFYSDKESGLKNIPLGSPLQSYPFLVVDEKEFQRHGMINLYFDVMNLDNSFLKEGTPFNYFKIDFYITEVENVFSKYSSMFSFDLLGQPGRTNNSVIASVEQCLVDKDLQKQMMNSPFYSIFIKCNQY